MMAKRFFLVLGLLWGVTACAGNPKWQGEYIYEADLGENAAEQSILVEYVLEIGDNSCKLTIQGYQVSEIILCSALDQGRSLNVNFQSYEDGSLKNQYGIQIYSVDQTLFHLNFERELVTQWDALVPDELVSKTGKYFLKTAP